MTRKMVVAVAALEDGQREAIRSACEKHSFQVCFCENDEEAAAEAADCEIIFGMSGNLGKNARNLRWINTPSAGVNQFMPEGAFIAQGVIVTNSSGAYGVTIAEHIVMVTLEMLRRQQEYTQIVENHRWVRNLAIRSIMGSRVTFLGTGDIGTTAAKRIAAFEPGSMTGINRSGRNAEGVFTNVVTRENMGHVLEETDILICSLPGTRETQGILSRERLHLLPDGALVVNVGRGTVIDQSALEDELQSGRLFAALDVFEREPLPEGSGVWNCPNLLITPHVAGNMTLPYTKKRIVEMFLENFEKYCNNEEMNHVVDLSKGY